MPPSFSATSSWFPRRSVRATDSAKARASICSSLSGLPRICRNFPSRARMSAWVTSTVRWPRRRKNCAARRPSSASAVRRGRSRLTWWRAVRRATAISSAPWRRAVTWCSSNFSPWWPACWPNISGARSKRAPMPSRFSIRGPHGARITRGGRCAGCARSSRN